MPSPPPTDADDPLAFITNIERLRAEGLTLVEEERRKMAEVANVDPPADTYVRQYPLAELQPPAQVLVDNGMVIRDPTGWEIFQSDKGGYSVAHDDISRYFGVRHYPEESGHAFTSAWEMFQHYVQTDRARIAG